MVNWAILRADNRPLQTYITYTTRPCAILHSGLFLDSSIVRLTPARVASYLMRLRRRGSTYNKLRACQPACSWLSTSALFANIMYSRHGIDLLLLQLPVYFRHWPYENKQEALRRSLGTTKAIITMEGGEVFLSSSASCIIENV
jgi:hypothetical protein